MATGHRYSDALFQDYTFPASNRYYHYHVSVIITPIYNYSDDDDNDWNWESWSDWYDSWSSWSDWVRATPWTSWDSWSSWDYTTASNYGYGECDRSMTGKTHQTWPIYDDS